jgi:outer membrane protein assembly factor BamB
VANGIVYFGAADGYIYALDAATGDVLWEWNEGVPISAEIAIGDRAIYVATRAGQVIAIGPVAEERLAEGTSSDDEPGIGSPGAEPPDTANNGADSSGDESPTTTVPERKGGGGGGTL